MDRKSVGVIGLGLMGTALTERLLSAGYVVHVHNRSQHKAEPLVARGAHWSENPLINCDRVILSLFDTDAVVEVLAQMHAGLRPSLTLIDTTTGDPRAMTMLGARLAARGVTYLDAPISGSSEQTRRGEVTTIVGGPREAADSCQDLFQCFSQQTIYAGPVGNAAKLKLISNLVLGLNRAALAEGLVFARSIGLEANKALAVFQGTVAYSRAMDAKGQKMVQGDFRTEAKLSQHLKDVHLMLQAAAQVDCALPFCETLRGVLEHAEAIGLGEADNSAIIRALEGYVTAPKKLEVGPPHFHHLSTIAADGVFTEPQAAT